MPGLHWEADDPYRERVYAAETLAWPDGGRRFTRFSQIDGFITSVVISTWWDETFPDAPIEIEVMRRSRGATFSAATVDDTREAAAIWIRDGSWTMVTVLHELAHVASAGTDDPTGPHGKAFLAALAELWRQHLGFHAYGSLQSAVATQGMPIQRDRLG